MSNRNRTGSNSRDRGRLGRPSRAASNQANNDVPEEFWKCEICKVEFRDPSDKVIQCDRCNLYFCIKCIKMSEATYAVLSQTGDDCHWYCFKCKEPALHAVRDDREIEERCQEFFEKINERLEKVEKELLPKKADKTTVDTMSSNVIALQSELKGAHRDISILSGRIDLVRNENKEKDRRKNNVIVVGLPENDGSPENDIPNDSELAEEVLKDIEVEAIPKKVERLGTQYDNPGEKGRPLRIILPNEEIKQQVIKNAPMIRKSTSSNFNKKIVFINPDYTKLEREDAKKLRDDLKAKRLADPVNQWVIAGNKVVKKKPENSLSLPAPVRSPPRRSRAPSRDPSLSPPFVPASQLMAMRDNQERP